MRKDIVEEMNSEEEENSEEENSDESDSDEWTEDEDGISDARWETMRTWECDITPEEDGEHRHYNEEHCEDSRDFLTRKAKLVAENARLKEVVRGQDECLARMKETTERIQQRTAERRVELIALRAGRARKNASRGG